MTPKEKAEDLVNSFRMILMNEDTDCGNEILCTSIAKKNALIAVDEILKSNSNINIFISSKDVKYKNKAETEVKSDCKENLKYWQEVKQEILKL